METYIEPTEDQIQKAVKEFSDLNKLPMHHSPNAGKRSKFTGKKLKDFGMMVGFSDCFFLRSNSNFKGLFLELKTKTGKLTREQLAFINLARKEGFYAETTYGLDAALAAIRWFYHL